MQFILLFCRIWIYTFACILLKLWFSKIELLHDSSIREVTRCIGVQAVHKIYLINNHCKWQKILNDVQISAFFTQRIFQIFKNKTWHVPRGHFIRSLCDSIVHMSKDTNHVCSQQIVYEFFVPSYLVGGNHLFLLVLL